MQDNGNQANQLTDAEVRDLIVGALEDQRYDWRTIEGISEQTGIPQAKVREVLETLQREVVRSSVPDELGRSLYTTRKHYRETHGLGERFLSALSDKVT